MIKIRNDNERKIPNILSKRIKISRCLYKKPTEQLLNLRRDKNKFIAVQSPYTSSAVYTRWSDFCAFDDSVDIDMRIEVTSLKPIGSDLKQRIFMYVRASKAIVEKLWVLILLEESFDISFMNELKKEIKERNLPVITFRTIEEFEEFFESKYRK